VEAAGLAHTVDSTGDVAVAHADGLGSIRALTDTTGSAVQTYRTEEFGVTTQTKGTVTQPIQSTGEARAIPAQ
jgi:hypothetical protein